MKCNHRETLFHADAFYTRTHTFTHKRFYTQTLLHTEAFPHRRFTHRSFYTDAFTHRPFYTQALLHTKTFTHRRFYTRTLLHANTFTHRRFYTQTLLHTGAFTHRRFYTQGLIHADTFTHKRFYTQTLPQRLLHRRSQSTAPLDDLSCKQRCTNIVAMEMLKKCKRCTRPGSVPQRKWPQKWRPISGGPFMFNAQSNAKHLLFEIQNMLGTMMPWMTSVANKGAQT